VNKESKVIEKEVKDIIRRVSFNFFMV